MSIRPWSRDELKASFDDASPFRFLVIDDFLEPAFAQAVCDGLPDFEAARAVGREFASVNEKRKVQISDPAEFSSPVARLNELLAGDEFLSDLEYITGIPRLLADAELRGGGIHITGPRGRLDVHVDFNLQEEDELHRRLNILVYLNPVWYEQWGGAIELWDPQLKRAHHTLLPVFNRCVLFETSEISFHGVTPTACPEGIERRSFAAYYYTREAPAGWDGSRHSTIFRARPHERLRRNLLMPAERISRRISRGLRRARRVLGRGGEG
jgi:Rps23 Pro-64 3,4-dihydroxylase Tpa1-like proline 4-hydroxylase